MMEIVVVLFINVSPKIHITVCLINRETLMLGVFDEDDGNINVSPKIHITVCLINRETLMLGVFDEDDGNLPLRFCSMLTPHSSFCWIHM